MISLLKAIFDVLSNIFSFIKLLCSELIGFIVHIPQYTDFLLSCVRNAPVWLGGILGVGIGFLIVCALRKWL